MAQVGAIGTGSGPTSIQISGNYAFAANPANNMIQAINISNPSAPGIVSLVSTDNYPLAMSVSGDFAYVVNFSGNTMQVINISNPASMTVVGSVATDRILFQFRYKVLMRMWPIEMEIVCRCLISRIQHSHLWYQP
ncbi:MAG: hypothetical protein HWD58_11260 [Bacteroidota bacterium]|nr:MAG: hypothetical protein HWD58_11260 [Bacteroidota bacterium]